MFRVAPDADECSFVKHQLNSNEFVSCQDLHCISNLLKVWFRDLPEKLLNELPAAEIEVTLITLIRSASLNDLSAPEYPR